MAGLPPPLLLLLLLCAPPVAHTLSGGVQRHTPASPPLASPLFYEVPCPHHEPALILPGCSAGVPYTTVNGSTSTPPCGRFIQDGLLRRDDVDTLLGMVERGFAYSTVHGGPSILDINSGYLRDAHGLLDVYSGRSQRVAGAPPLARRKTALGRARSPPGVPPAPLPPPAGGASPHAKFTPVAYTPDELALYKSVFDRIKGRLQDVFGLASLWFTAPTFVARIVGDTGPALVVTVDGGDGAGGGGGAGGVSVSHVWAPASPHDEYWHPHVDGANTGHYHWSGLLYLSTQEEGQREGEGGRGAGDPPPDPADFTAGGFTFLSHTNGTAGADLHLTSDLGADEEWSDEHSVAPRAGRLLLFSSGQENVHAVRRVASGVRYVFSMWFTCDEAREFGTFLDGKAHSTFKGVKREGAQGGEL